MNELNPQDTTARKVAVSDSKKTSVVSDTPAEVAKPENRQSGKTVPAEAANTAPAAPEPQLDDAVVKLNDYVQSLQRDLKFSVDADLGRPVVSVVDSNTQQVIRKIPSDVVLKLARNLKDVADAKQSQAVNDSLISGSGVSAYGDSSAVDVSLIDIKA